MAEKKPVRLLCTRYPKLRIHLPKAGGYIQFEGGYVDIAADDPAYDEKLERAKANPNVSIAKAGAAKGTQETIKTAGEFVCDICNPAQNFATAEKLAEHTADLHTAAPVLGEDGSDTPATDRRPRVRQGTSTT